MWCYGAWDAAVAGLHLQKGASKDQQWRHNGWHCTAIFKHTIHCMTDDERNLPVPVNPQAPFAQVYTATAFLYQSAAIGTWENEARRKRADIANGEEVLGRHYIRATWNWKRHQLTVGSSSIQLNSNTTFNQRSDCKTDVEDWPRDKQPWAAINSIQIHHLIGDQIARQMQKTNNLEQHAGNTLVRTWVRVWPPDKWVPQYHSKARKLGTTFW